MASRHFGFKSLLRYSSRRTSSTSLTGTPSSSPLLPQASITDIVGGRSGSYEKSLKDAKNIAVQEMIEAARAHGANAIIAIDLDYETLGKDGGMMMVSASGTAVKID